MRMKDYFTLYSEPEAAYTAYDVPTRRTKLRLIRGGDDCTTVVDLGQTVRVPGGTKRDPMRPLVLRKVRVHNVVERHGAFWTSQLKDGEEPQTLEGWVSPSAFPDDTRWDEPLWEDT